MVLKQTLVPLVVTFVLFNLFKIYIGFSIIAGILAGILLFWRHLAGGGPF